MRDTVNVWLAKFESERQVGDFFDEQYGDDDAPISKFAESQQQSFYDHDWLEVHFHDGGMSSLLRNVPDKCAALVEKQAAKFGITDANCVILFFDEWSAPQSTSGSPSIWHIGEFSAQTLQALRPAYEPGMIDAEWWVDFPTTESAIAALRHQAAEEADPVACAKLGAMLLTNVIEPQDEFEADDMLRRAQLLPVALRECLEAVAKLGHADPWMSLFKLTEHDDIKGVTQADRVGYLEQAAELGSCTAQFELASLLMYSYLGSKFGLEPDYERAEALLLRRYATNPKTGGHALYCLYAMEDCSVADPEKALHWGMIEIDRTGSTFEMQEVASAFFDGGEVEADRVQAAKYWYLSECQTDPETFALDYMVGKLDDCTMEELQQARILAKEWIRKNGDQAIEFGGEKLDPLAAYLEARS